MSRREERAIRNERLFREVNIQIAGLEERVHSTGELLPLLCECAETGCATPIEVAPAVFEAVREHQQRYLVAPGHERPAVESVVERQRGYLIVEKHSP